MEQMSLIEPSEAEAFFMAVSEAQASAGAELAQPRQAEAQRKQGLFLCHIRTICCRADAWISEAVDIYPSFPGRGSA